MLQRTRHTEAKPVSNYDFRRVSWGAIIGGALTAVVLIILLNLLGLGIGLATIEPVEEAHPLAGLSTGAGIWWVLSNLVALFAGGWVAGRLAGFPTTFDGILHGFLSWALYTLVSFWLLTSAMGSIVSGVGQVISKSTSLAAQGLQAVAPEVERAINRGVEQTDLTVEEIKNEAFAILEDTEKERLSPGNIESRMQEELEDAQTEARQAAYNPERVRRELESAIDQLVYELEYTAEALDREALVNLLVDRTDLTEQEARQTVDGWIQQYQQVKEDTRQLLEEAKTTALRLSDDATDYSATAAVIAFFALLLGATAACFGGSIGTPGIMYLFKEEEEDIIVE